MEVLSSRRKSNVARKSNVHFDSKGMLTPKSLLPIVKYIQQGRSSMGSQGATAPLLRRGHPARPGGVTVVNDTTCSASSRSVVHGDLITLYVEVRAQYRCITVCTA